MMKTLYSHIALSFLLPFGVYAQDFHSGDNSMQYNNTAAPSGNSGFAGAAASLSVNLYTGGLQASLPLYTLKSSDLQIPITLSYTASNGVRPSDQNTVAGMDWMLSAGGSISRIVKGLPDESDNGYIGTNNYGLTVLSGYNTPSSGGVGNFNNNRRKRVSSLPPIDGEPDIFVINTPYFTARFTLDQNGNAVFQNNTGLVVTHRLYKNSNGGALGITVTDDQGTHFTYTDNSNSAINSSNPPVLTSIAIKQYDPITSGSTATATFTSTIVGDIVLTEDGSPGQTYSLSYSLTGPMSQSGTLCASRGTIGCGFPSTVTFTNAPAGTYTLTIHLSSGTADYKGMMFKYYGAP